MKNLMYMLGGVTVGVVASKYSKDIMKLMKKETILHFCLYFNKYLIELSKKVTL